MGLAVSLLAILGFLVTSGINAFDGQNAERVRYALYGGSAGFAAGMMLAASSFSLILPGLEAAKSITGSSLLGVGTVVVGLGLGVMLMLGPDRLTHASTQAPVCERINRVWLFVFAITLHNLPEGMAIGVGFAAGDLSVGIPLASAIAYPLSLGLAAGAMLCVVAYEIIPSTHRHGHQPSTTLGLMGGCAVMMFLDTVLG